MGLIATTAATAKTNGHGEARIKSYAPATGELLGEVPNIVAEEVRAAVARARKAQEAWGVLPVEERCARVLRFRDAIVDRADEIVGSARARVRQAAPRGARSTRSMVVADIATYFAKTRRGILAPHELQLCT